MNIFILDYNPKIAAQYQADKHVVKQVLETAQILSTVCGGPYKPTHAGHPCTIWAGQNITNLNWLIRHGLALAEEYTYRYQRRHKSEAVIRFIADRLANQIPSHIASVGVSPYVQCMPDEFRDKDPVVAYRKYYHSKSFAQWNRGRAAPYWWEPKHES